ncbi:MAG: hypothetical protein PHQ47_02380 [Candidatus Portnoybacteria bacterium]|nr:hypothetical protein [Candidatus Portnoybacteria bacterium]
MGRLKKICRDEIKKEFGDVENKYKDIIAKIESNRNRLVAHLDEKFYEIPYSEDEIARMADYVARSLKIRIEDAKSDFASMPRSTSSRNERYSIGDFKTDLPKIKQMLETVNDIWSRSLPFITSESDCTKERNASIFLSLSLRFSMEYLEKLCNLKKEHGDDKIQESKELTIFHRVLWTALIVEVRKLFGASFKRYRNYSLREIEYFKSEPYKSVINTVYGNQIIQRILTTSNTFTIHLGETKDNVLSVSEICNSNLRDLLEQLRLPIDAFREYSRFSPNVLLTNLK